VKTSKFIQIPVLIPCGKTFFFIFFEKKTPEMRGAGYDSNSYAAASFPQVVEALILFIVT